MTTGQDLTTCVVCRQPLAFVPRLGELIAHDECADYVNAATSEAMSIARRAERTRLLALMDRLLQEGLFTPSSFHRLAKTSIMHHGPAEGSVEHKDGKTVYTHTERVSFKEED